MCNILNFHMVMFGVRYLMYFLSNYFLVLCTMLTLGMIFHFSKLISKSVFLLVLKNNYRRDLPSADVASYEKAAFCPASSVIPVNSDLQALCMIHQT